MRSYTWLKLTLALPIKLILTYTNFNTSACYIVTYNKYDFEASLSNFYFTICIKYDSCMVLFPFTQLKLGQPEIKYM